jgi:hypothetical protein
MHAPMRAARSSFGDAYGAIEFSFFFDTNTVGKNPYCVKKKKLINGGEYTGVIKLQ